MEGLALINGKVYVEKGVYAEGIYIEDGIIRLVGGGEEVLARTDWDTEIIDLQGKTVIPGLNDSHQHLIMVGTGLLQVKTTDVRSIDELVDRCREYIAQYPERCEKGIYSCGWNQDLFEDEKRIPNRHDLDRISTEIPVVLSRVCGHVSSANTKAIEMLGLKPGFQTPPGGTIETEADGYPSGVFTENCVYFAQSVIPPNTKEDLIRTFRISQEYALSKGLTSVQSNDIGQCDLSMDDTFAMFHEIYEGGIGKLRYRHQVYPKTKEELLHYIDTELKNGRYDDPDRFALGPVKLFKDGSLGGRTALMRREYEDDPGNFGVCTTTEEEMNELCKIASDAGLQVVTHVIGDEAIASTIRSYEKVSPAGNPLRHGLVHCQITDKPLLQRIADDGILAFYQPVFLDYDMHAVVSRCGRELSSTSYAFKTARDLGIHVSYGTDSPVEDLNPFPNIYHAVTRKDKEGWPMFGFYPQEKVTVEEAIDDYTIGSAYAEFKEKTKGRLKPGYLADLVVLDKDIFTCDPDEIYGIEPVLTMIGGEVVYQKK